MTLHNISCRPELNISLSQRPLSAFRGHHALAPSWSGISRPTRTKEHRQVRSRANQNKSHRAICPRVINATWTIDYEPRSDVQYVLDKRTQCALSALGCGGGTTDQSGPSHNTSRPSLGAPLSALLVLRDILLLVTARILAPADLRCRQRAQPLSPSLKQRQVVPTIQPKQARTQSRFNHTFLPFLAIPSPADLPSWILLGKALKLSHAVKPRSCIHINKPCLLRHSLYGDRFQKQSPLYIPDRVSTVILRVRSWFLVLSFSIARFPLLLPSLMTKYSSLL